MSLRNEAVVQEYDDSQINYKFAARDIRLILSWIGRTSLNSETQHVPRDLIHFALQFCISFDFAKGTLRWNTAKLTVLPRAMSSVVAVRMQEKQRVMIVSGMMGVSSSSSSSSSNGLQQCLEYNARKDTFTAMTSSKKPNHSIHCDATLLNDGRILTMGGSASHLDLFDSRNGQWETYPSSVLKCGLRVKVVTSPMHPFWVFSIGGSALRPYLNVFALDLRNMKYHQLSKGIPQQSGHYALINGWNHLYVFGGTSRVLGRQTKGSPIQMLDLNCVDFLSNTEWLNNELGFTDFTNFGCDVTDDYRFAVACGGYFKGERTDSIRIWDLFAQESRLQRAQKRYKEAHSIFVDIPRHNQIQRDFQFRTKSKTTGNDEIFTINQTCKLPCPVTSAALCVIQDSFHVFGGWDGRNDLNAHWVAKCENVTLT